MIRFAKWDLLLVGLLVSPLTVGVVFIQSMYGLLTVEIVPADQGKIPTPSPGDLVEVYGTWVRDAGHPKGDLGWNEIHPAVYLTNLTTGVEGGSQQCKLLADIHDPERLVILDASEPCKWARGRVQFLFTFDDGDLHIDLRLDSEYQHLAKSGAPLVPVSYPLAFFLVAASTTGFGAAYAGVSLFRPNSTILGRFLFRYRKP